MLVNGEARTGTQVYLTSVLDPNQPQEIAHNYLPSSSSVSSGYSLTRSCTSSLVFLLGRTFPSFVFSLKSNKPLLSFQLPQSSSSQSGLTPPLPASLCPYLSLSPEENALSNGPPDRRTCPCVGIPDVTASPGSQCYLRAQSLTQPGRSGCSGSAD